MRARYLGNVNTYRNGLQIAGVRGALDHGHAGRQRERVATVHNFDKAYFLGKLVVNDPHILRGKRANSRVIIGKHVKHFFGARWRSIGDAENKPRRGLIRARRACVATAKAEQSTAPERCKPSEIS